MTRAADVVDPARAEAAYWHARRRANATWDHVSGTLTDELAAAGVAYAYGIGATAPLDAPLRTLRYAVRVDREGRTVLDTYGEPVAFGAASTDLGTRIQAALRRGVLRNAQWLAMLRIFNASVEATIDARPGVTYCVQHDARTYWFVGCRNADGSASARPVHGADGSVEYVSLDAPRDDVAP